MSDPFLEYGHERDGKSRWSGGLGAVRRHTGMFGQIVLVVLGFAVATAVVGGALSLVRWWMLAVVTLVLGAVVAVRSHRQRQRAWWLDNDCCGGCGYDLQGLPTRVCPECGRDGAADEPTWRRVRREHEARFGRTPQPAETFAASQLDEAEIRRLLARADESARDL